MTSLENERDQLDQLKEELNLAQIAFDEILEAEEEKQASYCWFDVRDREYTECRMRISERIRMLERKSHRSVSVKSGHSGRSKLSASSRASERSKGSARSLRLEVAAKSARLRAEMEFLDEETEVRRLQLMKDIAIANAEERAIKQVLDEENGVDNADKKTRFLAVKQEENIVNCQLRENVASAKEETEFKIDPLAIPFVPKSSQPVGVPGSEMQCLAINTATLRELVSLQAKQTELSSLLITQQKTSNLPVKEPPVFSGDPFNYPSFIAAFDSIICDKVSSDKDRLYFLQKYTKDKANDVVKGFLAVNSESAYSEARKLLDHRFGNPVHVAEAYKSRLCNWPQISDGDSTKLQAFSDFLIRCQEAAKTVGATGELDSTQTLLQVGAKLPSYSGVKWCRHAYEKRLKSGSNVSFSGFVKFVKEEADLANDPIFSPDLLKREKRKQVERDQKHKGGRGGSYKAGSFATNTQTGSKITDRSAVRCPLCERNHKLDSCADFKGKTADNRRDFVSSKGLCFGCLKTGHLSRSCQSRLTCKECGKPHPTSLHGVKPKRRPDNNSQSSSQKGPIDSPANDSDCRAIGSSEQAGKNESKGANASVCGSTGVSDGVTSSMIVPVVLHQRDNPDVEVNVYALVDNGSDSTFVKSSILRELGVEGPETSLQLNTMYGETEISVQRVEGLVVQRFDRGTSIELPKTYSRDSIPSKRDQIPTPEIAGRWPHLERIKVMIHPIRNNVDIGILIRCNCSKALKPQEVILENEDDPYAIRTLLGWGIIGPVRPGEDLSVREDGVSTCNRFVTREIGGTRLDTKFVVNQQTKEVINPFDVRRMFEFDFSERHQGGQTFSLEDRRFVEIAKKGIHHRADGHYEIPLPIKDKDLVLPNNRTMAYNRLKPLKKRFQTNETYRQHYVEFMDKVIQNGYAEKVPKERVSEESDKLVWYIPHHGVYHPKKPNKIRVVFDCSAQFQGESLNNHLLQGPDLTNNLTGVLRRFRREPVALMCDIEAMFYQVNVPEEHRDLLRFLWWDEADASKEPQEYRMAVHLFGAASSPSCSNFALKATADDNEESLGSAPAEFLRRDFYVDDRLQSVPSVEEGVDLVKSVKEMCKRGGFNLHKFTSNNKEVIQQIPESDRAEEMKKLDFDRDALPMERALGIQWCIESDTFKFSIALKDRPCTRRGILSTVSSIFDPLGFVAPLLLEGKAILQELCRNNIDWDDPVPTEIQTRWMKWKLELRELQNFAVPRCYKTVDFGQGRATPFF